jgi:hypothetical protein
MKRPIAALALLVLCSAFTHHGLISRDTSPAALSANQYSLELAGTSGYARIGAGGSVPSDMDVDPLTDSYSAHIWMRTLDTALPYQFCLFARAKADSVNHALFLGLDTTGEPYLIVGDVTITATTPVNDGEWHSIGIWVGSGAFGLVVDGVQEDVGVSGVENSTYDYLIGGSRYSTNSDDSFVFQGQLQNLTWWTTKLSVSDLAKLHNRGTPVNPTTHPRSGALTHWWPLGQDQDFPQLSDERGSDHATAISTPYARLTKTSPIYTPSALGVLGGSGINMHFVADDWDGSSSSWSARVGSWTAAKQGSPVKSASGFTSRSQISNAGWWRVPNDAAHRITSSTQASWVFAMNAGALNSSGGFWSGYDATVYGKSSVHMYNYGYVRDAGFRIRTSDDAGDYLAAESSSATHPDEFVTVAVTVDMTVPRVRTYILGGLLAEDTSTSGAFASHTDAPWGILGIAYSDSGGFVSTANDQTLLEMARYDHELTANEVALLSAEFNAYRVPPAPTWANTYSCKYAGTATATAGRTNFGQPAAWCLNLAANDFTVSFWFKRNSDDGSLLASADQSSNSHFRVGIGGTTLNNIYAGGNFVTAGACATSITNNTWYLLTAAFDGSGNMNVYVGNSSTPCITFATVGTQTCTRDWIINTLRSTTNADTAFGEWALHNVDELTFWSTTLDGTDHVNLQSSGHAIDPTTHADAASLTSYFRCGDDPSDTSTTVYDQIGSNDGTHSGSDGVTYQAAVP